MSRLEVTFIDVGWGDSILIEHEDSQGKPHYGLVDCNDSTESLSSYTFVKQHFELNNVAYGGSHRAFDFVLLTHWHTDHYSGLKRMMRTFGTRWFLYPKTDPAKSLPVPLRYARAWNSKVDNHQSVDLTKTPPAFGDVQSAFRWPPHTASGPFDPNNANNNSVVLDLRLDRVRFILTGDCEAQNWIDIVGTLPRTRIRMFQAPHHGAKNGMFSGDQTPWLDFLGQRTKIALSSHVHPHHHPHPNVVQALENDDRLHYRTDQHYHVTFRTDGRRMQQKWSRY